MKFIKLSLLLTTLLSLTMLSCHKDIDDTTVIKITVPGPTITTLFKGSLTVYVTDLSGNAVEGAIVFVYDEQLVTNTWGIAEFDDIPLDANGTYVRALKDQFFFGSDKFFPSGTNNFTSVRLLPIENAKTFDPSSNVTIEVEGGGNIAFDANSIADETGANFDGEVFVHSYRLGSEMPHLEEIMPGALIGLDQENRTRVLGTYAMIAVELRDKDGNELNIKEGEFATITFPVEDNLLADAPIVIPLWFFDEFKGVWIEEGEAALEGNNYVGEVSHFSFWNCDAPFPLVNFEGKVLSTDGEPISTAIIKITAGPMVATGYTDGDGNYGGKFPKDENMLIEVIPPGCSDPVYSAEIGPFSDDVVLDDIIIGNNVTISGDIICTGNPFGESIVIIKFPNKTYQISTDENGAFSLDIADFLCNVDLIGEIFAQDPNTNIISAVKTIDINNTNGFIFDVCSDCDFTYEIAQDIPDMCESEIILTLTVENGSGDYSYVWGSGETTNIITINESQSVCVTITDNIADCEYPICETINVNELLVIDVSSSDITCDAGGFISIEPFGGSAPYVFNTFGPGGFSSNDQYMTIVEPGSYTITVIDNNNCEVVFDVEIVDYSENFDIEVFTSNGQNIFCLGDTIYLSASCQQCSSDLNGAFWSLPDGSIEQGATILAHLSGIYTVEIQGANCFGFGEITLEVEQAPMVEVVMDCINGNYISDIPDLPSGYSYQVIEFDYETTIQAFPSIQTGDITVFSNIGCAFDFEYNLPSLETGIDVISINPATCDTCEDGYLVIEETNINCNNCNYDTYYIYKEGEFTTDLREENESQTLSTGLYYLVGKSTDGCVIYSSFYTL